MTRTGVPHARPSEVLTTSCLLDEAVEARKSGVQGRNETRTSRLPISILHANPG